MEDNKTNLESAIVGGGCFWCVESVFRHVRGVKAAISGYAGGHTSQPDYKQICTGQTGHAEVVKIVFDSTVITYREVLEIFFATHDPTSMNRQGNDVGTQYRSVIFFQNAEQQQIAESVIAELGKQKVWDNPIVTEVSPAPTFYPAEDYHQDYFTKNPWQPYCAFSIPPKLEKLQKYFPERFRGIE